jgi:hypothetical protein
MPDTSDETGGVPPTETPGAGGSPTPGPADDSATEAMSAAAADTSAGTPAAEAPAAAYATDPAAATAPMGDGAYGRGGYGTAYGAPAAPPQAASGLRRHWPWIVGAVVAGFVLLLGGVALGATIDRTGDWLGDNGRGHMNGNGMMRGDDRGGQYGPGGMMDRDDDAYGPGNGYGPGGQGGYGQNGYGCPGDPDDCPQGGGQGYGPGYGAPDDGSSEQPPCPRVTPSQQTPPQSQ